MHYIYHIAYEEEWLKAFKRGTYQTASLEKEGFIHCCFKSQIESVLNIFFKPYDQLVILEIDPILLVSKVVEENKDGGDTQFPHIYGPINIESVVEVNTIQRKE